MHNAPRLAMWYGVDPMAEKYPSMGAYVYCANNPVKLVDPDGRKIKGFSINEEGQVIYEKGKASKDAVELYNVIKNGESEIGLQSFKGHLSKLKKMKGFHSGILKENILGGKLLRLVQNLKQEKNIDRSII